MSGLKLELFDVLRSIVAMKDSADLPDEETRISNGIFNVCLKIRRLLSSSVPGVEQTGETIRIPKIDVPKFNSDITNWPTFWEQFDVAIHSKPKLTNSEKLAYLRQAVKDGPAKNTIKGLAGSGDNYLEAIACLQSRYDKPRLLH